MQKLKIHVRHGITPNWILIGPFIVIRSPLTMQTASHLNRNHRSKPTEQQHHINQCIYAPLASFKSVFGDDAEMNRGRYQDYRLQSTCSTAFRPIGNEERIMVNDNKIHAFISQKLIEQS